LHFTELEGSLPHSQEPATCLYSNPDQSSYLAPFPNVNEKNIFGFSSVTEVCQYGVLEGASYTELLFVMGVKSGLSS
jgi:hypothetical protein